MTDPTTDERREKMKQVPQTDIAEALYVFVAWLTTREKETIFSADNDAAPAANLVDEFIRANGLPEPSDINTRWGFRYPE